MNEEHTPGSQKLRAVDGRIVAIGVFLLALVAAVFTWFEVPKFVVPFYKQRPRQSSELFDHLESGLRQYYGDHGALPPEHDLMFYRRRNKNAVRAEAFGMTSFMVGALTTPVTYWNIRAGGDPFAMPDQFTPPAYFLFEFDEGPIAVLSSSGPNLRYEIRPETLESVEGVEDLKRRLDVHAYDPTNGARSGGDLYRLIQFQSSDP